MRFTGEIEGLEYIKGKTIKNPSNYTLDVKMPSNAIDCQKYFDDWIHSKRYMFSPQEYKSLKGDRHKDLQTGLLRDHYINVFVDWAERRPRRRAIIVIEAGQKKAANAIAREMDVIGGDSTFSGLGLSPMGTRPATHFWCSWNCSEGEYNFFESQKMPWWQLFDGDKIESYKVLFMLGLQEITEEL